MPWEYPSNRGRFTSTPAEIHALIARGCVLKYSDASRSMNMRGITYWFRSLHDSSTPCGERAQWHRRAVGMPDHNATLASERLREEVIGGYDRRRVHQDRELEDGESREFPHRVGHLYTDPTVKEETGPRLRNRGGVATAFSG